MRPRKRNKSSRPAPAHHDNKFDQVVKTLNEISTRVNSSPVLNGGFTKLVEKIDDVSIAQEATTKKLDDVSIAQEATTKKLDEIHTAIYEPDEGLFARIKASESLQADKVAKVERDVVMLSTWKQDHDFHALGKEETVQTLVQTTKSLELQTNDLSKWKTTTMSILKWVLGIVATSSAGVIVKVLYDLLA